MAKNKNWMLFDGRYRTNEDREVCDVTSIALTDMMAQITKNFADAEENVIKEVLRQLLKREPTLEDAKDLHKFQLEGEFDKYYLAYKNLKLGTVYRNTNIEGGKMGVEFVPFEMKDFLEPATNSDVTKVTF
jgi:Na+-translocating ferredoxin:NAD+ oxidoreductase RnfG subunit